MKDTYPFGSTANRSIDLRISKRVARVTWRNVKHIYADQRSSSGHGGHDLYKYPVEEVEEYFWGSCLRFSFLAHITSKHLCHGSRILDAGAGYGLLAAILKATGFKAFACDIFNRHEIAERLSIPYSYWHMEAHPAPYDSGYFDGVILSQTIEHFTYSPRYALSEMIRITRSGGILVIDAPNISSFRNVWRLLRGKTIHWSFAKHYLDQEPRIVGGVPYYDRHNHEYAREDFADIAKFFGLGLLEVRYYSSHNIWKRGWVAFVVSKMRDWVKPRWRKNICGVFRIPERADKQEGARGSGE